MARSWIERHEAARDVFVPWMRRRVDLAGASVVDFGCGAGSMALALAPHVESVLCLDESDVSVAECERRFRASGDGHVVAESGPFDSLIARVAGLAGGVDVFMLFAVLEHMTIAERLTTLATAAKTLSPDGVIVIAETPNRLLWNDYHTTETPFFGMVPDELAIDLAPSIRRIEVARSLDGGARTDADRSHRLVRLGRGASYHEFEAVFGPGVHDHIIATGWDPDLSAERPEHRDERYLSRFLTEAEPRVASCFSRYWLDLILKPGVVECAALPRPAPLHTLGSREVAVTPWETAMIAPGGSFRVDFGRPSTRAVVNAVVGANHVEHGPSIRVSAGEISQWFRLGEHDPEQWVRQVAVDFARPCESIVVGAVDAWVEVQSVISWPGVPQTSFGSLGIP